MIRKLKDKKAFTMIEVIVTVFIVAAGFLIMFTVFELSIRQSVLARNYMLAQLIADSMIEEVQAHRYGEPQPERWTEPETLIFVIQGRKNTTVFNKKISFDGKIGNVKGNGSFVDNSKENNVDVITVTLTWNQATAVGGAGMQKTYKETLLVRRNAE